MNYKKAFWEKAVRGKVLAVSAVLGVGTLTLSGCMNTTGLSATGVDRKQMMLVSGSALEQSAASSYAKTVQQARSKGLLDTNPAQVARLRNIANRLVAQAAIYRPDAANWKWEVHTIKSSEINAYVMPGGKIIFYTGIIDRPKLTDGEIAAIMGHEIAHALREHSRERASMQFATSIGVGLAGSLLGLSSREMDLVNLAGDLGLNKPHNRKQESEADQLGLELMARAGYKPQEAISLWQKMSAVSGDSVPQILSTHPNNANRIAKLQSLLPAVTPLYQQSRR